MNLKLLNSLEKDLGKTLRTISKDEFLEKFVSKKLAEKYLQNEDDVDDLFENLDLIAPQLKVWTSTMRSILTLRKTEENIEDCFLEFKINNDKDALKKRLLTFVYDSNVLISLSGIVCSVVADVIESLDLVKIFDGKINDVEKVLKELDDIKLSYGLRCDIIDLVIQCREYLKLKGEKPCEIYWLDNELDKLHEFEFNVLEKGIIPEINISPETFGYIDITRLKGKEE